MPEKKRFPKCVKAIRKGSSKDIRKKVKGGIEGAGETLADCVQWILKEEILKKNPMEGLSRLFRNLFPLFLLVALLVPFIYPTTIETTHSNMRDRIPERNKLSVAPSFDYTFDGKENLRRIARYAIGRFNAVISDDNMIRQYLEETISENGYKGQGWESNMLAVPPQGTVIKFSRPDNLGKTAADSIGAAWKYWTSILSDSIAYITEFYNERGIGGRKHNGIDIASRKGARILAPFSAKAYTSRDERGGVIMGLVREKDVMLFMHCDQLLYLDGQEVMQGDPIATVGMTGHTTGPHAHVVTGVIDKRGNKRIGNVKYKVIDPIAWYYKFKPNTP
jgi:murein DD-endopeptidase MepM/ murein hydrolase activator NlpD